MIVFRNPGVIDLDAVRTMGVSVKAPGSFGYFGTGLKYAVATILRGGGEVFLCRGPRVHKFTTGPSEIRGETFNIVKLDGRKLGFTDQLGRNWEPWMVLRELGCNATDEGGAFDRRDDSWDAGGSATEDETIFAVRWDKLEVAYQERKDIFVHGEPTWKTETVEAYPGPSTHLFYRGVRAYKLKKPSHFRYNILEAQTLTEDRTLSSGWSADLVIMKALLACTDAGVLTAAITAPDHQYEHHIDYEENSWGASASREFLDAVIEARSLKANINPKARQILAKHTRKASEDEAVYTHHRYVEDDFSTAVAALEDLGVAMQDRKMILVDELPGEAKSLAEDGRIYVLRSVLRDGVRAIAEQLLSRVVEMDAAYGADGACEFLVPLLLQRHRATMVRDRKNAFEFEESLDSAELPQATPEEPAVEAVVEAEEEMPF